MKHDWMYCPTDTRERCSRCGLYSWYDVRTTECRGRYTDNDSLRPPVNETAKRELGFDLVGNYERDVC